MKIELFSLWGKYRGLLSKRDDGFQVSAVLGEHGIWYTGADQKQLERAFYRACRRIFFRRLLPFLSLPPSRQLVSG